MNGLKAIYNQWSSGKLELSGEQIIRLVCVRVVTYIYLVGHLLVCACRSRPTLRTRQTTTSASPRGSRWRSICLPPSPPNRYISQSSSSSGLAACLYLYGSTLLSTQFVWPVLYWVDFWPCKQFEYALYYQLCNFLQSFFQNAEPLVIKHLIVILIFDNYSPATCYIKLLRWRRNVPIFIFLANIYQIYSGIQVFQREDFIA